MKLKEIIFITLILGASSGCTQNETPIPIIIPPPVLPSETPTLTPFPTISPPTATFFPTLTPSITPAVSTVIPPTNTPTKTPTPKLVRGDLLIKSHDKYYAVDRNGRISSLPNDSLFNKNSRPNCSSLGSFCIELNPNNQRQLLLTRTGQSPGTVGITEHRTNTIPDGTLIAVSDTLRHTFPGWGADWTSEYGYVIAIQRNISNSNTEIFFAEIPESHHQGIAAKRIDLTEIKRLLWDEDVPIILGSLPGQPRQIFQVLPKINHELTPSQQVQCTWTINVLTECHKRAIEATPRTLRVWEIPGLENMPIDDLAIVR